MSNIILSAQHLVKTYQQRSGRFGLGKSQVHALNDVSIALREGTTLAVVGESGSGKSTLARCLLQLQPLDSGEVNFQGENLSNLRGEALRKKRRYLQMVFQDPFASLNPRMRIGEIVGEGLDIHQIGSVAERKASVISMMERVGLTAADLTKYPHEFSGGQRQRIGIARALIMKPKVVICDEPVSALDVSIQAQILLLLKELQQEMQLSYVFISHDLRVVRHIANDIVVMQQGKIVESGEIEAVYQSPKNEYTRSLLSAIPGRRALAAASS